MLLEVVESIADVVSVAFEFFREIDWYVSFVPEGPEYSEIKWSDVVIIAHARYFVCGYIKHYLNQLLPSLSKCLSE